MNRDVSAWKVGDKAWMTGRKEAWKAMKPRVDKLYFVERSHIPYLKSYFLTGVISEKVIEDDDWGEEPSPQFPLESIPASILLECWLSADLSVENWERIKQRYVEGHAIRDNWISAQRYFLELVDSQDLMLVNMFDGMGEQFYRFFGPGDCRREDFPDKTDEEYATTWAPHRATNLTRHFHRYMDLLVFNPHHPLWFRFDEYRNALAGTYAYAEIVRWITNEDRFFSLMRTVLQVRNEPSRYDPLVVKMASALYDAFEAASTTEEKRQFWARAKGEPATLEEEVLSGATLTYYLLYPDSRQADSLLQTLAKSKIPVPGWIMTERDGERGVIASYKVGPTGVWDIERPCRVSVFQATILAWSDKGGGRFFRIEWNENKVHGQWRLVVIDLAAIGVEPVADDPTATLRRIAERI